MAEKDSAARPSASGMNRPQDLAFIVLILAGSLTAPPPIMVWVTHSLDRIAQNSEVGSVRNVDLAGARGEIESFQLGVRSSLDGLRITQISFTDLRDGENNLIPSSNFTAYTEHYVWVEPGSPNIRGRNRPLGPGWYADALVPVDSLKMTAGVNQPFWVDVNIPRDAVPGSYSGWFTVTSDQASVSGDIRLKVWRFTLPLRPTLQSSFGLRGGLWQGAQEELLKNKVAPAVSDPKQERIHVDQLGLSITGLGFWSGANVGHCGMDSPPPVSRILKEVEKHDAGLMFYNYSADEVDACASQTEVMKAWARNLHAAGVSNLVTRTPSPELFDDGSGTGRSAVDIWALLPIMYDKAPDAVRAAQHKGDQVWSYNALSQDGYSPKWLIDYAPVNFRIQPGFISQSLGLTGILYWRSDFWGNTWDSVNNFGTFGAYNAPGEGMLLYRLETAGSRGAAPSIRLKWIRDGVEDFEYVDLLKKRGWGDWALGLARTAGRDWVNWSQDAATLLSVRQQLGDQLERLSLPN